MQVADLAPSFSGVKTEPKRSPNRASKRAKPELQPNTFLEPGLGHLPRKRSCCYKCKKIEVLDPDPLRFRVYNSTKTGRPGGCSGSKKSCLGLRNLGLGSEGILIYTLRGVLGGFQGSKSL